MYSKKYLLNNRMIFHCKTEASAKLLLSIFHEYGFKWGSHKSLLTNTLWYRNKEKTYYTVSNGGYVFYGVIEDVFVNRKIVNFDIYRIKHIAKQHLSET